MHTRSVVLLRYNFYCITYRRGTDCGNISGKAYHIQDNKWDKN